MGTLDIVNISLVPKNNTLLLLFVCFKTFLYCYLFQFFDVFFFFVIVKAVDSAVTAVVVF